MSSMDLDTELRRKGMTGRALAQAINCEEATVSRYRRGLTMTDYHARRIAEVLTPHDESARTPVTMQASDAA